MNNNIVPILPNIIAILQYYFHSFGSNIFTKRWLIKSIIFLTPEFYPATITKQI